MKWIIFIGLLGVLTLWGLAGYETLKTRPTEKIVYKWTTPPTPYCYNTLEIDEEDEELVQECEVEYVYLDDLSCSEALDTCEGARTLLEQESEALQGQISGLEGAQTNLITQLDICQENL